MAGFFKRLLGTAANENTPPAGAPDEVYKGVEVFARPVKESGQWRVAGALRREKDGAMLERKFMRADLLPDEASAKTAALGKAHMIIDQNGESLWQGEERMV
ncbi:HlyU family transcriptional regulator [Oricola cellulosilytica]|nr:HlyU family transcriptional regulator [Oricola cellulosilytica]